MDAVEAVTEAMARFAYEDAYPGKPWGMADGFTQAMFRGRCAFYAPAALAAARPFVAAECAKVAREAPSPYDEHSECQLHGGFGYACDYIAAAIEETIR